MLPLLLLVAPALATCEKFTTVLDLRAALDSGYYAWITLEKPAFFSAVTAARSAVVCLAEPLDPSTTARFYLQEALNGYLQGDEMATVLAFESALIAEPSFQLSPAMAPGRHPLQARLSAARIIPSSTPRDLSNPASGAVFVDGRKDTPAPTDRPFILQVVQDDGKVQGTWWVQTQDPTPWYPAARALQLTESRAQAAWPYAAAAVTATAASGILYGMAWTSRARFDDPDTACTDLEALRSQTNLFAGASGVMGMMALGAGVTAVVIRF